MGKLNFKFLSLWLAVGVIGLFAIVSVGVAFTGNANVVVEGDYIEAAGSNNNVEIDGIGRAGDGVTYGDSSILGDLTLGENLTVDGTSTLTGAVTITGALTASTALNSLQSATTTDGVAITLTAAESGKLILIKGTGAGYTLPAVTNTGAFYTFQVKAAFGTNAVVTSAEGDNIDGSLVVADAVVACSGEDFITFVADGEVIGDQVTVYSDGTNWNITHARGETAAKITCTDV